MKIGLGSLDMMRFGSVKRRIAVLYAALFAAVLAIIMVIVGQGIGQFGESNAERDLASNARVFDEIIDLRANQMRSAADVLSRDFGFREAVATDDRPTIASALDSLRDRSSSSAAFVVGHDGSIIGSTGDSVPSVNDVWGSLDDGVQRGVIRQGDGFALAAASPIEIPDVVGWLVLTQPLDNAAMARLTKLAAVDLTAQVTRHNDLPQGIAGRELEEVFEVEDGDRYLYRLSSLPAMEDGLEPNLVLRHSLTASLAEYAVLNWLIAGLALAGLLLVIALSWRVARTITKPLHKLEKATRLIGEGRQVEIKVETEDEIGRLATSFNAMITAIDERERKIVHVGLHDGLTNLPNRKLFTEQLSQAISRRKDDEQLMVIYVDLDDFKMINDTLGHPAGDSLLSEVAAHLQEQLPDDTVARLGGDEFAILIGNIGPEDNLAAIADQVQNCFIRTIMLEGQQAECTASLGIAVAPGDGEDGSTLMKHADLALYRAKHEGKASYHFFEPSLDEEARQRRMLEMDLRSAIREGQFELYFQPLYSLSEERLKGFEALIRWEHPERGMVSPVEFIPLAEETGLILPIGEWVLREACHQASTWSDDLSVAVNISPKQFTSGDLAGKVMHAIAASGIDAHRLELEITESIFISNIEKTLATLHSVRGLGVRIALDDFGTGYSSLSYLRSFPFDKVKIDKSFVDDLGKDDSSYAFIRAITTLADALGMETLAEGVEDAGQLEILRAEGCRNVQGYLLSRPLSVTDVREWMATDDGSSMRQIAA